MSILKVRKKLFLVFLIIIDVGEVDRYLNFKMESGTSVYKSCTATMNGGTFVFGGHYDDKGGSNARQVHFDKNQS